MGEHFIGIDLGGTNIQAGLLGADGALLARERTKTKADQGLEKVLERIEKIVDDVLEDGGQKRDALGGVGIGAPGAIDVERGVVINAVNLRWNDVPLAERLKDRLDVDVVVDNDVNVGTWGEHVAGAGRDYDDLLGVFVGTGIGSGLVLGGALFHGAHRTAGEIGHTILNADAPPGRRTLENLASRTSVVNLLRQMVEANESSAIPELADGNWNKVRSKILSQAYEQRDPLTVQVLTDAARYVGTAIANTTTLLSLPATVLGGGLVEALGEPWVTQVREAYRARVFPRELGECPIFAGQLGDDAGLIGAGWLARSRLSGR